MKTKKEFPATHSMDTSWFVADEDGNVALFDFDDNGPVPVKASPERDLFLMFLEGDFTEKDNDSINTMEFTDEQVEELMADSVSPDKIDLENSYELVLQINEEYRDEFIRNFSDKEKCCLSHKQGIYYLESLFANSETDLEREVKTKTILKAVKRALYKQDYDYYEMTKEEINAIEKRENWNFPFYHYQPYYDLAKKMVVPKYPFKENQIPEKHRNKLIRVPLKFSECSAFQIAQYTICKWYSGLDETERDGRHYTKFSKTGGGFCYILENQDAEKDGEFPIVIDEEEK